jgi:hypothetical protein
MPTSVGMTRRRDRRVNLIASWYKLRLSAIKARNEMR